jgi:hypothetical protein
MNFTRKYIGNQYSTREDRNKFIATELEKYIGSTVLNVGGGGKKHLKKYLRNGVKYYELDMCGSPDLLIDLEKELPISVGDDSYETVICTDVLEHLDNLHDTFRELVRVSSKYIIISLPNSVETVLSYFRDIVYSNSTDGRDDKQHGKYMKFYGLPFEKPDDRHKWFFSYVEAEDFFMYQSKEMNFKIREMFPVGYYRENNSIKQKLFRAIINTFGTSNIKKNLYPVAFSIVIEK